MNRADGKVATEKLPSFFDQTDSKGAEYDDEKYTAEQYEAEQYDADQYDEEFADDDDEAELAGDEEDLPEDDEDLDDVEDDEFEPRSGRSSRASHGADGARSGGGGLAMCLGITGWLAGIGVGMAGEQLQHLAKFGLTPTTLFVLGAVAFGAGCVRRWLNEVRDAQQPEDSNGTEELSAQIAELLERQHAGAGANAESLGDVQQVLLALQKQDDKTNNLTKAIKMYGKPLMDIANHGTELAATLAQVKTAVDGGGDSQRAAWSRIESLIRKTGGDAMQEQLGRFEVAIQAVSQRLEDAARTLIRLEDAAGKSREQIDELSRGESVEAATKNIQQQLEDSTRKLQGGIEELREANLGELETTVRDIQREVATIATAVSQIQAAIKAGGFAKAAPAPAAASAPAPAKAPSASKDSAPDAGADGDESAGYSTGARRSKGKNVLGAIAKLKQMKG